VQERNYSLQELSRTQLGVERHGIDSADVPAHFDDAKRLVHLVRHTERDAFLAARLMFKLNVLPLSKQLTNLCGNLWYVCLSLCICCVCVCVHVCVYIYIHVCVCMYIYIYICVCVCVHVCVYIYIYIRVCVCVCVCVHVCMCVCVCVDGWRVVTFFHIWRAVWSCTYIYICISGPVR